MTMTQKTAESLSVQLDQVIERAIAEQRIVGTVVLAAHDGDFVYGRAAGFADRGAGFPMAENSIFRLSSLAKPMVAATTLAMAERGLLQLNDNLTRWIPEFRPALANGSIPQ